MSKGYKTFREFVDYREGATIRPTPGLPAGANDDAAVDAEIAKNPQLLKQGVGPQQQKMVDKAIMNKKTSNGVSMDAALKAAAMQQKRLQQNAGVGGAPGGAPGM